MGKDGVAPPEPEGNRFTVCPATIYGIFPLVRFPLRLSLPPRVYINYGRFSAGIVILCEDFRYSHIIRELPGHIEKAGLEPATHGL